MFSPEQQHSSKRRLYSFDDDDSSRKRPANDAVTSLQWRPAPDTTLGASRTPRATAMLSINDMLNSRPSTPLKRSRGLDDLPEELLSEVFGFFCLWTVEELHHKSGDDDIRWGGLRSLCLVSRKFCRIAQPMLYGHIDRVNEPSVRCGFLRTLLRRPDLAACVRSIDIWHNDVEHSSYNVPMDREVREAGRQLEPTVWVEGCPRLVEMQGTDAELTILLSRTPNLQALSFSLSHNWLEKFRLILRLFEVRPDNFPALRYLRVKQYDDAKPVDTFFFQYFLTLPTLREIECSFPNTGYPINCHSIKWSLFKGVSDLKKLTLNAADVSAVFLRGLLGCCKALETFTYHWGEESRPSMDEGLQEFLDVLKVQKGSLKHLSINAMTRASFLEYIEPDDQLFPPISSLRDFTVLKSLHIDGKLLTGETDPDDEDSTTDYTKLVDVFPDSLEILEIDCMERQCDVDWENQGGGDLEYQDGFGLEHQNGIDSGHQDGVHWERQDGVHLERQGGVDFILPFLNELAKNTHRFPSLRTLRLTAFNIKGLRKFEPIANLLKRTPVQLELVRFTPREEELVCCGGEELEVVGELFGLTITDRLTPSPHVAGIVEQWRSMNTPMTDMQLPPLIVPTPDQDFALQTALHHYAADNGVYSTGDQPTFRCLDMGNNLSLMFENLQTWQH